MDQESKKEMQEVRLYLAIAAICVILAIGWAWYVSTI